MENRAVSREFSLFQRFIEDKCGIFIDADKSYLFESRLAQMLAESSLDSFEKLYAQISSYENPEIVDDIIDMVTVNETFWFRDRTPWIVLEEVLLPAYVREFRGRKRSKVRIWSSACSYGQEPYSIAMCIDNYLERHSIHDISLRDFEIFATDISNTVLQMAETGRYDNISIQRGLDEAYKSKYFTNEGRIWTIIDKIRGSVQFEQFNLIDNFLHFGSFDIVFLRNVMIYFTDELKRKTLIKLRDAMKPGGVLFIGSSELLCDHVKDFKMEQHNNGIYFRIRSGAE